ncbi:hypothetical protein OUZ56_011333 [Daphnia magna]|uniref:Uncharacterized protein n=1 Tax=Daphnia magna TaxID=35525 RepID=A0ABQ9YZU7_9CRUS|nr:hypothetical protein OUZ56_011333 [Daphnia magna]
MARPPLPETKKTTVLNKRLDNFVFLYQKRKCSKSYLYMKKLQELLHYSIVHMISSKHAARTETMKKKVTQRRQDN